MQLPTARQVREMLEIFRRRFDTLVLEYSVAADNAAIGRAAARLRLGNEVKWIEAVGHDSTDFSKPGGLQPSIRSKIWWRKPSAWREELTYSTGGTVTTVASETESSMYLSWLNTLHTSSSVGRNPRSNGPIPSPSKIEELVEANPLLSQAFAKEGWEIQPTSYEDLLSRPVVRLIATWTRGGTNDDVPFGDWVDEYVAFLDLEFGILLKFSGMVEGSEATIFAVESVEFNTPISDDRFLFEAPARVTVVASPYD